MSRIVCLLLGAAVLVAGMVGCGSDKPADLPPLVPTTVTVTQDGNPITNATIAMSPLEGKWGATGSTDDRGVAVMKTNGRYDGVAVGEYALSVNKMSNADSPFTGEETEDLSYEEAQAAYIEATEDVASVIPDHLTIVSKSPIGVEVVEGENPITIEINDYTADMQPVMPQ